MKNKHISDEFIANVEVYSKAGRWLLEFPDTFYTQDGMQNAFAVLDIALERAHQL